jgi:twitching motility protein PilT
MAAIDALFKIMVEQGASDLHLTSGAPPYLRIHGYMQAMNYRDLTNQDCQSLIFEILSEKQKKSFVEKWELDFAYFVSGTGRFRANVFMQRKGLGAVFRVIPEKVKTVQELNLPPTMLELIDVDRGLVLVTGPTGSGKSTTLAALLHHLNMTRESHMITIEDPIEFVHQNVKSLVNQREVGSHTKSFANALKSALREDPDILLVGEMRDLETISLALTAAETGHLVFATLHTNSAAKTIDRIIDVFPTGQQAQIRTMLSESLRGVIAQTLFARADGRGRVAAFEIMRNTKAIANLIREGKIHQIASAIQTGQKYGMVLFDKYVEDLVKKGLVSRTEANQFLGKNEEDKEPKPAGAA